MAPLPGMPPCGRGVPPFFHPCMWEPPGMPPCGRGVPPFFIRACGNRRQRRGDIHVARVRAPLRCVCVRHVRSVAFVPPACVPSCLDDVCLSAPVPGVINGAPTRYATVRSRCPVVFSSVRVETAVSVGATFMSPACVRCCTACASGMSGPWRLCRPRGRRRGMTMFVSPLLYRAS